MATGNDDDDGDGATGNGATTITMAMGDDDDGDGATGNEGDNDGDGVTGDRIRRRWQRQRLWRRDTKKTTMTTGGDNDDGRR